MAHDSILVFRCLWRGCLGAALALLMACSSGGSGGGAVSGGGSTGEGGAGGVRGSAAAASAADAAVGRGVDGKIEGEMTAEQACQAAVRSLSQRQMACEGDPDSWPVLGHVAIACPEYFFNSGSTRTVAGVEACLGEIWQIPCTDLELGLYPSCWSPGKQPAGAACAYDSSCASRHCESSSDWTKCGKCSSGPPATGERCAGFECGPGDFCHRATNLCTPGSTIVHAAKGQACDLSASPAVGCVGDWKCIAPFGKSAGICQPMPLIEVGQPCYQVPGICRPPSYCWNEMHGTSQCGLFNDGCERPGCDDASYCEIVGDKPTCVPRPVEGESCSRGDGYKVGCVPGVHCIGTPGVCTKFGVRGDPCNTETRPCELDLICRNGHCAPLGEVCP